MAPTPRGSRSSTAPVPPNSKSAMRLGACRRCASAAASMGMPVPMKAVDLSAMVRLARQIISSVPL